MNPLGNFTLEPMSAGDIIDRAVRLYRRNFLALVRTVLGPSLVAYTGSVLYYIGVRNFSLVRGDSRMFLTGLMAVFGFLLWMVGKAAFYAVLGGASRSLVYHFFDGTPLRARDVYRAVREKLWSLIGAMFMIVLLASGVGMLIYFAVMILLFVYVALAMAVGSGLPYWVQVTANTIFGVLLAVIAIGCLLHLYSRVVYVPQILMVEGKGVQTAISRSFALAGGEAMRIGALILFWFYVAWSLWLLLMLPLGWYAYWAGVDINPFGSSEPLWFNIVQQTMTQVSEILIAPIAMLGFTLLYIDSRVRKEGFDVEMMANRVLPPPLHPPQPEIIFGPRQGAPKPAIAYGFPSILGLNDYGPIPINRQAPDLHSTEQVVADQITSETMKAAPDQGFIQGSDRGSDHTEDAIDLVQVEAPSVELPTVEQNADTAVVASPVIQETIARVQLNNAARRTCQWCGTEAGVEDRFCRVCGSVF